MSSHSIDPRRRPKGVAVWWAESWGHLVQATEAFRNGGDVELEFMANVGPAADSAMPFLRASAAGADRVAVQVDESRSC